MATLAITVADTTLVTDTSLSRSNTVLTGIARGAGEACPTMTANNAPSPYVVIGNNITSPDAGNAYWGWRAFDDIYGGTIETDTCWLSSSPITPAQIGLDFGTAITLDSYSIRNGAGYSWSFSNGAPKNWTFEGSNDNFVSDVNILDIETNQIGWGALEQRIFFIDESTYRYFRINISANNGNTGYTQISEIEMYRTASSPEVSLPEVDSDSWYTLWDMSTIEDTENLGGETGVIQYQYSCHNVTGSPTWNDTWLTLTELQAESDLVGRFLQLKLKFLSGTASFQDSFIEISSTEETVEPPTPESSASNEIWGNIDETFSVTASPSQTLQNLKYRVGGTGNRIRVEVYNDTIDTSFFVSQHLFDFVALGAKL